MRPNFAALWLLLLLPALAIGADEPSFRRQVAPVLQQHCFRCHNSTDRKGDFSLQKRAELQESGFVEAGDPAGSHLLDVVTAQDGKPPEMPKSGDPLNDQQREVLRRWIAAGAKWPEGFELSEPTVTNRDWWSLQPIVRKQPPVVEDVSLADGEKFAIRSPIDAFVVAKLRENELSPSSEADRRTLIRRLYFDLIGLPPSPDAIARFLRDRSPRAYESLVDRLLESPRYGERWARHWLDVVKYADTCGYDKDKLRPNAWPYRDYVVRSFNDDKPYSRFVREQIAGDVLFPGEPDGILGLGFIAAGPWDFIGHVEVPESKIDGRIARHIDRDEMVTNTLNTFASTTVQCARCHNHKFDPITQEHYYGLQAIFAAVDRAERTFDEDPQVEKRRLALTAQLVELRKESVNLEAEIRKAGGDQLKQLEQRIAELRPKAKLKPKHPAFGYHSGISSRPDQAKWVVVDLGRDVEIAEVTLRPCHDEFQGIGAGFGFPVRFRVEASTSRDFQSGVVTLDDRTAVDVGNPGLAPHRISAEGAKARFVRVTATRLATRSNDYILALAEMQVLDDSGKNVAKGASVTSLDSIEAPERWRKTNLTDGIFAEASDEAAVAALGEAVKQRDKLLASIVTPRRAKRRTEVAGGIKSINGSIASLPKGRMVYAAATHFKPQGGFQPTKGKPRPISVLHRGNILQPVKPAPPGVLPILAGDGPLNLRDDQGEGDRRAALANWLMRRDHPLSWRSIVNRVWLYHFGSGIVASPNDFGRMGQKPTHPELLDWLACEFRDGGQSFKKLHKLIVTSSTYRQSSANRADHAKADGANRFLWRMNRRRLEAEEIRDAVLSVSGKLDPKMYGPGFYLFKIERPEHSPHFEYHKHDPEDANSHRRSIYRFIVRSQPDPFMTTLDCADSSQSTPQRIETVTSLQALSLLNNRFNLVMARHFASRLESEAKQTPHQIQRAVQLVAGRSATAKEETLLAEYAKKHGLPNLCRVLFNLNEFVYID